VLARILDKALDALGRVEHEPLGTSIRARALNRHAPRHPELARAFRARALEALEWDEPTWTSACNTSSALAPQDLRVEDPALRTLVSELHLSSAPRTHDFDPVVVLGRALADVGRARSTADADFLAAMGASFHLTSMGHDWVVAWAYLEDADPLRAYRLVAHVHSAVAPQRHEDALQLLTEGWTGTGEELALVLEELAG
jgi:hypothetical protein